MRYPVSLALLFCALLLLPACALRAAAGKDSPDLTVFFTSDTRGMLRKCGCSEGQMGGISARASYIRHNANPGRTIVLDAGDTFFDGMDIDPSRRDFYLLKSGTLASAIEASGCDAINLGEFDLAFGPVFLEKAVKTSGLEFLSANVSVKDGSGGYVSPFAGSMVKDIGGVRVGVAGVIDDTFPYASFPDSFSDVKVTDQAAAAGREIKKLAYDADIIILLAHESIQPVEKLAEGLAGVDVIIQGHTQEHLEAPLVIVDTLVFKGYTMGKYIGRLDIWLKKGSPGGKARIKRYKFSAEPLGESVVPDMEVEGIISAFREKLKGKAELPGGSYLPGLPEGVIGPDACKACHPVEYENWSNTAHARAYQSLVTKKDQYDPECLPCHTTGYKYSTVDTDGVTAYRHDGLADVTCEACHGNGAGHAAFYSGGKPEAGSGVNPDGNIRRGVTEELCVGCHNEANSPFFSYPDYLEKGGAHRAR